MHLGGKPPIGFSVDPETKKYVVDENEAPIVRTAYEMYLDGHGYQKIIERLNAEGSRSKRQQMFTKSSLFAILRNEKYAGTYVYSLTVGKKADGKRSNKRKPPGEVVRIEGGMPSIVEPEKFRKVQEMLQRNRKTSGMYKAKNVYLLSGLIRCGICGDTYQGNSRYSGRGWKYVSYRCARRTKLRTACGNRELGSSIVEEFVLHELGRKLLNERTMAQLTRRLDDYQRRNHTEKNEEVAQLRKTIASIQPQVDRLVDALSSGVAMESIQERLSALEAQKKQATARIAEIHKALSNPPVDEKALRQILNTYRNYVRTRNFQAAKPFVHRYVEKVLVYPDKVEVILKIRLSDDEKEGLVSANSEIDRDSIQAYRPKSPIAFVNAA